MSLYGDVACDGSSRVIPWKSLFTAREAQITDAQISNATKPNQSGEKVRKEWERVEIESGRVGKS